MRTKKAGRPFVYQSDEERPVSVSIRIPHALYDEVQEAVGMRRTTITTAILDGLRWWLDTPADPRELLASDESNTVMQELREMVAALVQAEMGKIQSGASIVQPAFQQDKSNTVMQEVTHEETPTAPTSRTQKRQKGSVAPTQAATRKGGRPRSDLGQRILATLAEHPEGLSAEELRVYVKAEKGIGDILGGMKARGTIIMYGQGKRARYRLAEKGGLP